MGFVLGALAFLLAAVACTPSLGDPCQVSTDCSVRGDRLCDTAQLGGYCTQLNCRGGSCPDEGACILFNSAVPGCGFDDRSGPFGSRVARSFCMAGCNGNGDCRSGYVCADPRGFPWNAVILDNQQNKRVCLAIPLEGQDAGMSIERASTPPVCRPSLSDASAPSAIEASAPVIQDGAPPPLFPRNVPPGPSDAAADGG